MTTRTQRSICLSFLFTGLLVGMATSQTPAAQHQQLQQLQQQRQHWILYKDLLSVLKAITTFESHIQEEKQLLKYGMAIPALVNPPTPTQPQPLPGSQRSAMEKKAGHVGQKDFNLLTIHQMLQMTKSKASSVVSESLASPDNAIPARSPDNAIPASPSSSTVLQLQTPAVEAEGNSAETTTHVIDTTPTPTNTANQGVVKDWPTLEDIQTFINLDTTTDSGKTTFPISAQPINANAKVNEEEIPAGSNKIINDVIAPAKPSAGTQVQKKSSKNTTAKQNPPTKRRMRCLFKKRMSNTRFGKIPAIVFISYPCTNETRLHKNVLFKQPVFSRFLMHRRS